MQKYIIALYIRLSLEDSKTDSMSIDSQRLILREYAMSLEEWDDAEVLEFIDNGHSGANFERPAVQNLLDMVREGKINCILVKDLSRFGRNSIETGYFIERVFPLYHTRFISVGDGFDTAQHKGDTGGMDVAFRYLISECYSRDMSVKTKSAKYAKMRRGEYQSKRCPYGYQKGDNGRMEIDGQVAGVVRQIFQWAAGGTTAGEITRKLYCEGVPTPGEYRASQGDRVYDVSRAHGVWSSSTVLNILRDERYIGTYVIGKRAVTEIGGSRVRLKEESEWIKIPGHHPAIVSAELFEQAKVSILRFSLPNKKRHDYLLRGKVFCGCCDHALSRAGKPANYYCRHSKVSPSFPCHGLRARATELEEAVFQVIRAQLQPVLGIDTDKDNLDLKSIQQAEIEKKLQALKDEKRQLFEMLALDGISLEDYKARKAGIDAEIVQVTNTLSVLAEHTKQAERDYEAKVQRQEIIREIGGANSLTEALADALIEKIYVFPDNRIEIAYKVQDMFVTEGAGCATL